jgi:DNA-binding response OmpR family regulator
MLLAANSPSPDDAGESIVIGPLEIHPSDYEIVVSGKRVRLTIREFQVLMVLAARPGRVITRDEIYRQVWEGQMPTRDRSVDVFVRKIRNKLAEGAPGWTYIHTRFGIGYCLDPEPLVER